MITDFVHLNWMFVEKDGYPREDRNYICLIRNEDGACELLTLWFDNDDNTFSYPTYDDFTYEPVFRIYDNVVAWADPTKYTFTCDPDKNDKCGKGVCFNSPYSDHSRTCCYLTTHLEYAKDYDFH